MKYSDEARKISSMIKMHCLNNGGAIQGNVIVRYTKKYRYVSFRISDFVRSVAGVIRTVEREESIDKDILDLLKSQSKSLKEKFNVDMDTVDNARDWFCPFLHAGIGVYLVN